MTPRLTLSRKVFLLLLLPLLFLLAFVQLSTRLRRDIESSSADISRSREVIEQTGDVLRLLENATGAMNGYALTHDARFASESLRIQRQVDPALSRLFGLLKDSPSEADAASQLATNAQRLVLALKRLREVTDAAAAGPVQDTASAIASAKAALDEFSRSGDRLVSQEERLDANREAALQRHWDRVDSSIFWGSISAAFLTLLLGWQLGRSITGRLSVLARNAEQFAERRPLLPPVGGDDEIGSLDAAFHQMTDALRRATRREQALMTNVADVICSFDLDGRFTAVSPSSAKVFGYTPADLIGRSWIELLVPQEDVTTTRAAVRAIADKREASIQARCRRLDGKVITVVWSATWSRSEELCFAVARDVTDRLAAENERQFYLETIDRLEEAVFELDHSCIVRQMSHAWSALSGERILDTLGRPLTSFAHLADRDQLQGVLNGVLSGSEQVARMRFRLPRGDGEAWVDAHLLPHRDAYGSVTGVRGVLRDVTQSYLQELKIAKLALHDPLTQLPNRTLLDDRLNVALAVAKRSGLRVAVAFIDVDNFKQINDRLGHDVGDRVLKRLADAMSAELRKGDTLARWGGDEFVVLLPDLAHEQEGIAIAQRLLGAANAAKEELPVTLSIGLANYPDHARSAEELLKAADRAMFLAKRSGRNNLQTLANVIEAPPSIH
jgi:diguanylate cyclase (GGDEF)-like protein/PAS domain S-box-containing protein